MMTTTEACTVTPPGLSKPAPDALAKRWQSRIESAHQHWRKLHQRIAHNRQRVAGFNWSKAADSDDFYSLRANLIFATMSAMLPHIYARNPEISVTPLYPQQNLKRLCQTLQTVTNRALLEAHLKKRAKAAVWAAMTGYFGVVKVMYQRDIRRDPLIENRLHDAQDHLMRCEGLMAKLNDPQAVAEEATVRATLRETIASLQAQVDIVAVEGLVLDRVLTENLLIDSHVTEFWDYVLGRTVVRAHSGAAGAKKAQPKRGGLSTKLHALTEALGNPLKGVFTAAQATDSPQAEHWVSRLRPSVSYCRPRLRFGQSVEYIA